ncbi:MAG: metal ABC transporter permease [candidate division Zixibacteria bacterium]|nr:metal ABC transporter permease [candidate division Zixibacteria bacterium]
MIFEPNTWIILTGILAAVTCSMIGVFLILKKNVMLGDGISHAALPGIALAFLIAGSRDPILMLAGATTLGLVTAFFTESLHRTGRLAPDAALGIVFTFLFAIGVILISFYAGQIDLDLDCVLYGEIAYTPWDQIAFGGINIGPRAFWTLAFVFLANLAFLALFYKQLKITIFDPVHADSIGINSRLYHYLLMMMVSLTIVAAFESVGANHDIFPQALVSPGSRPQTRPRPDPGAPCALPRRA